MVSRYLLCAASPIVLCAGLAHAQEEAPLIEQTVIVTLPGPDRTTDELIGNATILDRGQILDNLTGSLGDTLDSKPGVSSTFFGQGASRPVLRGLGAERVQVLTNGIGVIDVSAASPDHQVTSDGIDADKIEILRGPAALVYGGQAIGGVVNVIDGLIAEELPDQPFSGDAYAAYNSVNDGSEGALRGTFVTGPLVLSLSVSGRDFDDYDVPGFVESSALRASEEDEEHEDEDHDHDHDEEEEARGTVPNSFLETETYSAGLSYVGSRGFIGVAVRNQTSLYGLPGSGHAHGEEDEDEGEEEEENPFIDLDQTRVEIRGGADLDTAIFNRVNAHISVSDYEHTEFEAPGEAGTMFDTDGYEGRIELDYGSESSGGAVGVQFLDKSFSAVGEEAFVTPTDTTSGALFVYHATEYENGLGLEGGARIETVEVSNQVGLGNEKFDLVSASLGIHKHLESGWFFGSSLAYSERAPSDVELYADGPHLATQQFEVGNANLDVERGLNLEGVARWNGDRVSGGVNLFVTEYYDFIYLTPGQTFEDGALVTVADDLPVFTFVQNDVTFTGGEIYLEARAGNWIGADWTMDGSIEFVDAEIDGGGNLPFIPPLTLNAGIDAKWGRVSAGADLTLAAEQDEPGAGQFPTDGYGLLDLKLAYDLGGFGFAREGTSIFLQARNVTDEEARVATSVLKDVTPLPGRNIRFGLRAAF